MMKHFWKIMTVAALLLVAAVAVTGCSLWDPPYEELDEEGFTVSVRYDANGGSFKGSPNEVYVVDVFNPSDFNSGAGGKVMIPLIAPDDAQRKDSAFPVSKPGYFLAGWYTERQLRTDENGQPLDEYGKPTAETGRPQGYSYSGLWDFSQDVLTIDPSADRTSGENEITLYAAWVPYFNFEFYVLGEDGSVTLMETKQLITMEIPAWDLTTGKMNLKEFPAREGMTFEAAFLDEAMTIPAEGEVSGSVDYVSGTASGDGSVRIYTTWKEGNWFRISTPDQLHKNAGPNNSYILEADLDFTKKSWPTVLSTGEYNGTILGNGHTIANVEVLQGDNSKINGGLFGVLGSKAKITDLKLENVTFKIVAGSRMQSPNYGLLAGSVNAGATLTDVSITGVIEIGKNCYRPNDYNVGLICGAGSVAGMDMSGITVCLEDPENNSARVVVDETTGEVTLTFAD